MNTWHTLDIAEVAQELGTDIARGLDGTEAARRLEEYGPNELKESWARGPWYILWDQLTSSMVLILIAAAVISMLLGDMKDAFAILVIVILNALLGFRQEYKAEKAMAALKALAVPAVRVIRDGSVQEISALLLVPGDIVLLGTGNVVPADGRLIEAHNLQVQEAALTGESEPVEKVHHTLSAADLPLADRRNMVYLGTTVTYGRGQAVITGTGMNTELGRIASMIQTVADEPTPLQRRLSQLGRGLALAALVLVGIVFTLGLLRGGEIKQMFLIAISMAVAAIPEGLPAVVTIALALGSMRMLKRRTLIRKLPAVETLGSVTVICSDKTGTVTINQMTVTTLHVADHEVELETATHGHVTPSDPKVATPLMLHEHPPAVTLLLMAGALCNDAVVKQTAKPQNGSLEVVGDPTESALVMAAERLGLRKSQLEQALQRVAEVPFDSTRKRMTTLHRLNGPSSLSVTPFWNLLQEMPGHGNLSHIAFTKGSVDSVLSVSTGVLAGDRTESLSSEWRSRISAANDRLAQKGMRVLGVGFRSFHSPPAMETMDGLERDMTFIGMVAMIDPPRPEVKAAVETCKTAGIRPVMITGDHPLTAQYIATSLGISTNDRVVTGRELGSMSAGELEGMVEDVSVYARVSPEHKLHIVQALQNRGHIVAMTGDGVNDAPALKKADIGVAMGITGTDVTKQVADMVLLDDNFATIVAAVEEGRVIYDNIRKFIKYLLTTNSGEIWVMLLAPFMGMPLPLLPLQILWINLVTDGLPALALGVEPAERDVMQRRPYHPAENIFGRGLGIHVLWVGLLMGLVPLLAGYWLWKQNDPGWQTAVFTILTFEQMSHAMAIRSMRFSLFTIGLFSNLPLLGAVLLTSALQLGVVYVPVFQGFLKTIPLPTEQMILCIALGSTVFWGVELEKWFIRLRSNQGIEASHETTGV